MGIKKTAVILFFSSFCLFSWIVFNRTQRPIAFKTDSSKPSVLISPIISKDNVWYLNTNPASPVISTKIKMGSLKYYWINFKEIINANDTPYFNFIDAAKRIVEIENWGNEIPVIGKINDVNSLKKWWMKYTPELLMVFNYKNYNSWEASLVRYLSAWEREIGNINSENMWKDIMNIRGHLKKYREKLYWLAYNTNKSTEQKKYLFNLIDKIHSYLNSKLNYYIPEYSPFNIYYSLNKIQQEQLFGIYNITLNVDSFPLPVDKKITLTIGDDIIDGQWQNDKIIIFKNIVLDGKVNRFTLQVKSLNSSVSNNNWLDISIDKNGPFQYKLPIVNLQGENTYFLNTSYLVDKKTNLQLIAEHEEGKQTSDQILLYKELLPFNLTIVDSDYFTLPKTITNQYSILLNASEPLSSGRLHLISINIQSFLTPKLMLKKIDNLSSNAGMQNSVGYSSLIINYWLIILLLIGVILFILLDKKFHLQNTRQFKFLLIFIHKIFIKIRLLLFILSFTVTASFLLTYLLIYSGKENSLLVYILFFWTICLISCPLKKQVNFFIALIFLILCALSISHKDEILTEKLATSAYAFLIIGAIQTIFFKDEDDKKG